MALTLSILNVVIKQLSQKHIDASILQR